MCQEHHLLHCSLQVNPGFYTFILSASCCHMTPNQGATLKLNGRPHLGAPALLTLCLKGAAGIWETGCFCTARWMVAQEKPGDQDSSREPSSSQVRHLCAQLLPAGCVSGNSPLLEAPACQFQIYSAFLVKPRCAKQKLSFSVSPVAVAFPNSCRWALILSGGEHHPSNLTPKQPMQLSSLRDTFPQTANPGHKSCSSEPGLAILT